MSSYPFLSLNSDSTSLDGTGTAAFVERDLLQKYNDLRQSCFSMPEVSNEVNIAALRLQTESNTRLNCRNLNSKKTCMKHMTARIAFRTKSDVDVLNDGYKWRKYGKKMVKTNPHPRNYYRCSSSGCRVKKRVERARDDWCYIITTYEGVHNHHAPISPASDHHHYY